MGFVFFLIGISGCTLSAQDNGQLRKHGWMKASIKYVTGDWAFKAGFEERSFVFPLRQNELHVPKLQASLDIGSGFSIMAGGRYSLHSRPFDPQESVSINIPEIRFDAGMGFDTKFGSLSWKNQLKAEQRFHRRNENSVLLEGYSRKTRLRWKSAFKFPLTQSTALLLSNEFFVIPEGKTTVDQNRASAGFEYDLTEQTAAGLSYLLLYKEGGAPAYSPLHHVLVLSFSYSIQRTGQ